MQVLVKKNHKFKAAIFDMDGLLIDSEWHWMKYGQRIWSELGIVYTERFRKDIISRRLRDVYNIAKQKYNNKLTWPQIKKVYKNYRYKVYGRDTKLLKGAGKLLETLRENGMLVALGSSSSHISIDLAMTRHKVKKHFHLIVSASRMKKGKPHPAVYNKVMRMLKVKPHEAVIFEDSNVGVESAKASGAKVIAVPDKRWSHGDFSKADLIAKSLADKRIYKFLGLKS